MRIGQHRAAIRITSRCAKVSGTPHPAETAVAGGETPILEENHDPPTHRRCPRDC